MSARFIVAALIVGMVGWGALITAVHIGYKALSADWITGSGISYHLKRSGQNERNWGVGIEREKDENTRGVISIYDNSSNNLSLCAGAVRSVVYNQIRFGALGAFCTGYKNYPVPIGGPAISYETKTWGVNFLFLPASGGVLFAQAKWKFE